MSKSRKRTKGYVALVDLKARVLSPIKIEYKEVAPEWKRNYKCQGLWTTGTDIRLTESVVPRKKSMSMYPSVVSVSNMMTTERTQYALFENSDDAAYFSLHITKT